jgi:hypothetical protein
MHVPINVKSPNNISKWQMGFNSAFKGLKVKQVTMLAIHVCQQCELHTVEAHDFRVSFP